MRVTKPRFNHKQEFVWLVPRRLGSGKMVNPGDVIALGTYRLFVLKVWFNNNQIGPRNHPWTARRLEVQKARSEGRRVLTNPVRNPDRKPAPKKETEEKKPSYPRKKRTRKT